MQIDTTIGFKRPNDALQLWCQECGNDLQTTGIDDSWIEDDANSDFILTSIFDFINTLEFLKWYLPGKNTKNDLPFSQDAPRTLLVLLSKAASNET